ncbi:type I restriction endonuclease subunit R [Polyangium aurulentum]|uniref:type I restriction endonuclease subunit R n=1 Tax=Polyangium aurulentum TaxID=2567896 RepID=UPI0010ADA6BF|nr:type I restriction endonuclease subunit R [Polyangium aurulentum]UQA58584.1 type I restriction endonuclease subunit R [Polyangium aurulentum]
MERHRGTESDFELTTIDRLEGAGFIWCHGSEVAREDVGEVVLKPRLRESLAQRYPDLPAATLEEAVAKLSRPEGVDPLRRNLAFHQLFTRGFEVRVEHPNGRIEHRHIHALDWETPEGNEFLVVNQLAIRGKNDRRPDVLVYVNGLPLVLFELKNPYSDAPTVDDALNQVQHYIHDIPQLFEFNAVTVVSDGVHTLHGMWTASDEWYAPWKSIDGRNVVPATTSSMKALIEGLFSKERLLSYVRDFIAFEEANEKLTKKGAKYHQFFAVRLAAEKTRHTFLAGKDKRIGVIWHTTGSGKSLSMAFLVGILRRMPELENPSFVIQVDRNDLDNQLHDQFVAVRSLVGPVQHADSVDELRSLLRTEGGEVIFTTIEKFRLREGETSHQELSPRSNIIVIADEAHRSQYGFLQGYARYLNEALPNARRLGFTGTPVSFSGADTEEVFGEIIHTYDIKQSQEDKATVPIYYTPRMVKLHLGRGDVDGALKELTSKFEGLAQADIERRKGRWTDLAAAAGTDDRVTELAADLLAHFLDRTATLEGKALVVAMTRTNCVRLYNALRALPNCPEIKIVMTGSLGEDPKEWSEAGHLTTKKQREAIKKRMIDPADPLKMVIVCDMWLTGTDIPCLHTLYIDKPMRGHNMIQAISRVNRVFRDKPHGLIVDYIGIGDELREATDRYAKGGGKGDPAPNVDEKARPLFFECLETARKLLPAAQAAQAPNWRRLSRIELEDLYAFVYGYLADDGERRDEFLQAELRLTTAFLLVKHLDDCRGHADEVIFFQRVRKQLSKATPGRKPKRDLEAAVRDLVDDAVESEGVVDIFKSAGIERADVSILDDKFLQTFKDGKHENLRLRLLEKLLLDEIQRRQKRNLAKAKSFRELLERTLQRYHSRIIDAATVVQEMIKMRQEMDAGDARAKALGLAEDELAFYDAVSDNYETVYDQPFLRDLVHDVVQTIKKNLKVDWTAPHRDDIRSAIRAAVKRVLRRKNVKSDDFEPFIDKFMAQAEALYAEWPLAA